MTFRIRFGSRDAIDVLRRPPLSDLYAIARLRREIEVDIERRLDLLDRLDGDADFEDDGISEPSLGWTIHGGSSHGDGGVDLELNEVPVPGD